MIMFFVGLKQRHGAPRLTDELRPLQRKSRGSMPAPPGAEGKSHLEAQPGQLPRTRPACIRKSAGAGYLRLWSEPEVDRDITYLRTDESWLYQAVVVDLWSRVVTGWSMSPRMM